MSLLRERLIENYATHYARVLPEIDPRRVSPNELGLMQRTFGPVLRQLPDGAAILDLGCGTATFANWVQGWKKFQVSAVDSSSSQIAIAKECLPDLDIHLQDGLAFLRERPGHFDAIFCNDVLEHIPGDDLLLEWVDTARGALKPGGFFCCRMPNAASLLGAYLRHVDLTHQRAFTNTSMLQLLEAANLTDCRLVPQVEGRWIGRFRQAISRLVHRMVFLLIVGGFPKEVFTMNIAALGYRR